MENECTTQLIETKTGTNNNTITAFTPADRTIIAKAGVKDMISVSANEKHTLTIENLEVGDEINIRFEGHQTELPEDARELLAQLGIKLTNDEMTRQLNELTSHMKPQHREKATGAIKTFDLLPKFSFIDDIKLTTDPCTEQTVTLVTVGLVNNRTTPFEIGL
jgi:hypothetical protein